MRRLAGLAFLRVQGVGQGGLGELEGAAGDQLGLLVGLGENGFLNDGPWRSALTVGFLGAYTTFSTLMPETTTRSEGGSTDIAIFYLASSVLLGLVAVYGGLNVGRAVH